MIYLIKYMQIGTGIQAVLRFGLRELRDCNVSITDRRDLVITPLRLAEMS
jgi:hypothetical protein